ncbi:M16 family metallopeptidase [Endozoicomonadaceae bacterium StTr2]
MMPAHRIKRLWTAGLVVLLFSGCSSQISHQQSTISRPAASNETAVNPDNALPIAPNLIRYQLKNGLSVMLAPRQQPGVELRLLVAAGSLHEDNDQRGLAHFVEHMAFRHSAAQKDSGPYRQLTARGVQLGTHVNAATSFNSTVYRLSLPEGNTGLMDAALDVMAGWAGKLSFDPKDFDSERGVIVEEWRLRQGVGTRINSQLSALRYQGSRMAERETIGDLDIIRQAPMERAKAFYQRWYQPQRMTLVISGNFESKDVRTAIDDYFSGLSRGNTPPDPESWHMYSDEKRESGQYPLQMTQVFDPEQPQQFFQLLLQRDQPSPLDTLNGQWRDLIDQAWAAILNRRLALLSENQVFKKAQTGSGSQLLGANRLQQLMIVHPKGGNYSEGFQLLAEELRRLALYPVSESELQLVKQQLLDKLVNQSATEGRLSNTVVAKKLTHAVEFHLPLSSKQQQLALIRQWLPELSSAHIQAAVQEWLNKGSARLALVGSEQDKQSARVGMLASIWQQAMTGQPGPDQYSKPETVTFDLPVPAEGKIVFSERLNSVEQSVQQTLRLKAEEVQSERWQLSNGMQVVALSSAKLTGPVQVNVRIPGGRSLDPEELSGLVNWSMQLPEQCGYGDYSARELQRFGKMAGMRLSPYSELLYHGLSGEASVEQLEALLKLAHIKLTSAQYCDTGLSAMKKQYQRSKNLAPAERRFMDQINQSAYANGQLLLGAEVNGLDQFTANRIEAFHQTLLGNPEKMTIVVAGPVPVSQLKAMTARWLGSVPGRSDSRLVWLDREIRPVNEPQQLSFPLATSPKAMVQMHYSATTDWSPERQAAVSLIDIIANQRLRQALRNRNSGVYVVQMNSLLARDPEPYYLSRVNFTSAPERAANLTTIADKVIRQLGRRGISSEEMETARRTWQAQYGESFRTNSYWADVLANAAQRSKGLERPDELNARGVMKRLTLSQVNLAAAELLAQDAAVLKQYTLLPKL